MAVYDLAEELGNLIRMASCLYLNGLWCILYEISLRLRFRGFSDKDSATLETLSTLFVHIMRCEANADHVKHHQ